MKEKFKSMTAAEKRVAIAKDAIKQIRSDKLLVKSGIYIAFPGRSDDFKLTQKTFSEIEFCEVCQIGQAIVCGIHLFNKQSTKANGSLVSLALKQVSQWFSKRTATLMEGALMGESGWITRDYVDVSESNTEKAYAFHKRYTSDTERSIAIWKNVISNKGEFIP